MHVWCLHGSCDDPSAAVGLLPRVKYRWPVPKTLLYAWTYLYCAKGTTVFIYFLCLNQNVPVDKMTKLIPKFTFISAVLRIGCNLHVHNRSQTFQLATWVMHIIYNCVSAVTAWLFQPFHTHHVMSISLRHAGYDSPGSVLLSPVPHQMMSYMNMASLSRTELQLLNQLHCRRKRRHRTIFTDEQLEALEGLFQETKYPDVGTREQLARKVHLREEKVEVSAAPYFLTKRSLRWFWSEFLSSRQAEQHCGCAQSLV